jgi:hypothetical protein
VKSRLRKTSPKWGIKDTNNAVTPSSSGLTSIVRSWLFTWRRSNH